MWTGRPGPNVGPNGAEGTTHMRKLLGPSRAGPKARSSWRNYLASIVTIMPSFVSSFWAIMSIVGLWKAPRSCEGGM